jgi:hypothetical protein
MFNLLPLVCELVNNAKVATSRSSYLSSYTNLLRFPFLTALNPSRRMPLARWLVPLLRHYKALI